MRKTIRLVRERTAGRELRLPAVIGGTAVDEHAAEYAGADGRCTDAAEGIALVRSLMA